MNSIELACSSSAYIDITLEDAIHRVARIGYSAIEIRAGHEALGINKDDVNFLGSLKKALIENNLAVSNISIVGCLPLEDKEQHPLSYSVTADEKHLEVIKYYIRFASELNCSSVTVSPGVFPHGLEGEVKLPASTIEGLNKAAKFARGLDIAIGIMYGPGFILRTADEVKAILPQCRGLKIAFHTGRAHLMCETPCLIVTNFKQHIKHIHLADVGYDRRAYPIPGEGEIEWISFFKTLRWIGYKGYLTVDLSSYRDMPDLAAKRVFHYLSNIMNALNLKERKTA